MPFYQGQVVHFPKHECDVCPLRSQCTSSRTTGRSVSIHADESLLQELSTEFHKFVANFSVICATVYDQLMGLAEAL